MTEQEIKLQTRLIAIEHVLSNTLATIYLMAGFTRAQIEAGHRATSEGLRAETIQGADAAKADMWLGEIEHRVTELQSNALYSWANRRSKAGLPD